MVSTVICPQLLQHGTCNLETCSYNHNVLICEPCGLVLATQDSMNAHVAGKKHKSRVSGRSVSLFCQVCQKNFVGGGWKSHTSGRAHRTAAARQQVSAAVVPEVGATIPGQTYCELCKRACDDSAWAFHQRSAQHIRRERYAAFRSVLDEVEKDKHGMTIEGNLDFNIVRETEAAAGILSVAVLKTIIPTSKTELSEIWLSSAFGVNQRAVYSGFTVTVEGSNRTITQNKPINLKIKFKSSHIGRYEDRIEIVFEDTALQKRFMISRPLRAIVGNPDDHEALKPRAPYVPRNRTVREVEKEVIEGVPPPSLEAVKYIVPLPQAAIPTRLSELLSSDSSLSEIIRRMQLYLPSTLNGDTYGRHFKHLIWAEEYKMDRDIERYDIHGATLNKHNSIYYLDVPGLAEKRPSVLVGDRIRVQAAGTTTGRWFEGHAHVVHQAEVGLRFHSSFAGWSPQQKYTIHFKLNRIPMRRQHQALDTAFTQDRVLFPAQVHHLPVVAQNTPLKMYNPLIATNPPQVRAVQSIVSQPQGSVPFVIFGPPGTGKTVTMVEAIRQVLDSNRMAKILVCAPSNSAADLVAQRLKGSNGLTTRQLFRYYAPSRFKNQVPDELLDYTYVRPDGHFSVPPVATMKTYRVIVATCVSASVTSGIGIPRGHFSHIFVDEAGQATETEVMISVKTMADNATNVILSGDPKQLGPIIRSSVARNLGLEISYLERLMNIDVYDPQNGIAVVKLIKNFRSHNAILKFPNDQFYGGDLQPCADLKVINSYIESSYLPSKKFPIVFHSVAGKDDREASSPSFFNIDEITQVKSYVTALRADRKYRTTDQDIGIIAPYHAQCVKIRASLKAVADDVKVGSVEEFQGQERRVIIISTVRSSRDFIDYDLRHTLGFVANPRRFNVAVTRAQALLIVVGDPQVLGLDPLWRSFLNYIYENSGWKGPDIPWDPLEPVDEGGYDSRVREVAAVDMNDFTRRIEALTLAGAEDEDANVDRPWRDVE